MSKLDKKIMSIFVVFLLLASFIMPNITLAATEEITIEDSALKEILLQNADTNKDGKLSKEEMENLGTISLNADVKNLNGLEYATGLYYITIDYTGQSYDFSKLNAKDVNVSISVGQNITKVDLSFLSTFKDLKNVTITEAYAKEKIEVNYEALKNISTLYSLTVMGTYLLPSNIETITSLAQLGYLSLSASTSNDKVEMDLKGISNMKNLEVLNLTSLKLNNASEIGKLTELTSLGLYSVEGLGDYSYLSSCNKLESVHLYNLGDIDLSFLNNKETLTQLYIQSSNLKNLNVVNTLKNLDYVSIFNNTLASEKEYDALTLKDYTAYIGEKTSSNIYLNGFMVSFSGLFTYASNSDAVTIDEQTGNFTANKIGTATITLTAVNHPSVKKTFTVKVTGISANQALGTELGSSFVDGQTVLKANGELWKVYGNDAKAEKLATNVKKAVYDTVYGDNYEGFPYALLLKQDGTLEYQFNGVSSVITDAKDIYQTGYLKQDGTFVKIQLDGSWEPVATNVEKIVGSYLVKTDGKTYTVGNELVCNFPIVAASYSYVVDESGVIWEVIGTKEPSKVRDNFDHFLDGGIYVDKDGKIRSLYSGEEVSYKKKSGNLTLNLDNTLYLGEKEILTNVVDFQYLVPANTDVLTKHLILRTDGSMWTLTLNGEGALVKLEETDNVYFKENTLKTKEVYGDGLDKIVTITGFDTNNLEVSKALASSNFQEGYTAKAYDGTKELTAEDKLFTGATIKIYNKEGKLVNEFTALIYGDVTGTGIPSAKDALMIIKNKTEKLEIPTYLQLEAARVTENTRKTGGVPNSSDALAIIKAKLGKYTIEG